MDEYRPAGNGQCTITDEKMPASDRQCIVMDENRPASDGQHTVMDEYRLPATVAPKRTNIDPPATDNTYLSTMQDQTTITIEVGIADEIRYLGDLPRTMQKTVTMKTRIRNPKLE